MFKGIGGRFDAGEWERSKRVFNAALIKTEVLAGRGLSIFSTIRSAAILKLRNQISIILVTTVST